MQGRFFTKKLKSDRERREYLKSLGYKSDIFKAKFSGGKCGLSGLKIFRDAEVAYFEDCGLCLVPKIDAHIQKRDYVPDPKLIEALEKAKEQENSDV